MVMKPGSFIYNGKESWTENGLKMLIQSRPIIETPMRRREFKSPLGVSGELVFDENAYDSTNITLSIFVEGSTEQEAIDNRLKVFDFFNTGNYVDFTPYFDPDKVYKVIPTNTPQFESRWWYNGYQLFEITLKAKPYKYYKAQMDIQASKNQNIVNPHTTPSAPLIRIEGKGDIDLTINNTRVVIKDIQGYILVDSELLSSYKKDGSVITNENARTYFREYPFLKPGPNKFNWTGNGITRIVVTPRWRTLV